MRPADSKPLPQPPASPTTAASATTHARNSLECGACGSGSASLASASAGRRVPTRPGRRPHNHPSQPTHPGRSPGAADAVVADVDTIARPGTPSATSTPIARTSRATCQRLGRRSTPWTRLPVRGKRPRRTLSPEPPLTHSTVRPRCPRQEQTPRRRPASGRSLQSRGTRGRPICVPSSSQSPSAESGRRSSRRPLPRTTISPVRQSTSPNSRPATSAARRPRRASTVRTAKSRSPVSEVRSQLSNRAVTRAAVNVGGSVVSRQPAAGGTACSPSLNLRM